MEEILEIESLHCSCLVEGELFSTAVMLIFPQNLLCIRGGIQLYKINVFLLYYFTGSMLKKMKISLKSFLMKPSDSPFLNEE